MVVFFFLLFFEKQKFSMLNEDLFIIFFPFPLSVLWNLCLPQDHEDFSYILFQKFILLAFTFKSVVHFKLIFEYDVK